MIKKLLIILTLLTPLTSFASPVLNNWLMWNGTNWSNVSTTSLGLLTSSIGEPLYVSASSTLLRAGTTTEPLYISASSTLLRYGTSSDALTAGTTNLFYTVARVQTALQSAYDAIFHDVKMTNSTTTNATTTNLAFTGIASSYLATNQQGRVIATTTPTGGLGTVTSVDMSVPTGLTIGGNPITGVGTLALSLTNGYTIPLIANIVATTSSNTWSGTQTFSVIKTATTSAFASFDQTGRLIATTTPTGGTGTPAGSDTQIQFNNGGSFGASSYFTWNDSDKVINGVKGLWATNGSLQTSYSSTAISNSTSDDFTIRSGKNLILTAGYSTTGNVGIGTSTPNALLVVAISTATSTIYVSGSLGGRVILKDESGGGCTSISTKSGSIISKVASCPD